MMDTSILPPLEKSMVIITQYVAHYDFLMSLSHWKTIYEPNFLQRLNDDILKNVADYFDGERDVSSNVMQSATERTVQFALASLQSQKNFCEQFQQFIKTCHGLKHAASLSNLPRCSSVPFYSAASAHPTIETLLPRLKEMKSIGDVDGFGTKTALDVEASVCSEKMASEAVVSTSNVTDQTHVDSDLTIFMENQENSTSSLSQLTGTAMHTQEKIHHIILPSGATLEGPDANLTRYTEGLIDVSSVDESVDETGEGTIYDDHHDEQTDSNREFASGTEIDHFKSAVDSLLQKYYFLPRDRLRLILEDVAKSLGLFRFALSLFTF
jgi:hypothetical protein